MNKYLALTAAGLTAVGLFADAAPAAFVAPTDWARPANDAAATAALTTYQEWDRFRSVTANAPDVAEVNPNGTADAFDAAAPDSGSFVTGGGNLYSFGGVIEPRLVVPGFDAGADFATRVILQVQSFGNNIDTADLTVDGVLASTLPDYRYQELSRVSAGGGGFVSDQVDHLWAFTVPQNAASFRLDLGWGVDSSSFAKASVDTFAAVPEPASLALLGLVGLGLTRRRRH